MKTIISFVTLMMVFLGSSALPSSITNIQVTQGTGTNERLVNIQFDLEGASALYDISLEVSFDNGFTFSSIAPSELTGSLSVAPGTGIQLIWDGRISYSDAYAENARIRITASDATKGIFTDTRDGQTYKWLKIGDQVWMAENLKYLPEPDPAKISETSLTLVGPSIGSEDIPYAYVYDYDGNNVVEAKATQNYQNYGVLYNWPAAMGLPASEIKKLGNIQGVCPPGWHVPSNAEWIQLINYLITEYNLTNNADDVENGVGNRLKSCRQVNSPIGGECRTIVHPRWEEDTWSGDYHYGIDDFGFTALPAGYRYKGGIFNALGGDILWWSTDENPPTDATARHMLHYFGNVYQSTLSKAFGCSIRCVRDSD